MSNLNHPFDLNEESILQIYHELGLIDEHTRSRFADFAGPDQKSENNKFVIITTDNSRHFNIEEQYSDA